MTNTADKPWTVYLWFKKHTFTTEKEANEFYESKKSWFKMVLGPKTK